MFTFYQDFSTIPEAFDYCTVEIDLLKILIRGHFRRARIFNCLGLYVHTALYDVFELCYRSHIMYYRLLKKKSRCNLELFYLLDLMDLFWISLFKIYVRQI